MKTTAVTLPAIIPDNITGKPLDIQRSVEKEKPEDAIGLYEAALYKLQHPGTWASFATATVFMLVKAADNKQTDTVEAGDFIKIDLPGPGPASGDGFDWVQVECWNQGVVPGTDASAALRLRACSNPLEDHQKTAAHFFKDTATSTFVIQRKGLVVTALYAGRNEVPNIAGSTMLDKFRNAVVSFAAMAGFSAFQWTDFVDGLLKKGDD